MKKKAIIFLAVFLMTATAASCAEGLSFNFFRETHEAGDSEKVYGFMFVKVTENDADNSIYLRVTAPVNQIIEYKGLTTTIYYPDDNQAIIFESARPQAKINPMDSAIKKIDLGAAGFLLTKKQKTWTGRKEIWVPKDMAAIPIKEIVLGMAVSGVITLIEIKGRDGKIVSRMKYSDFVKIGKRNIPLTVETYSATGGNKNYEITRLSKPREKIELPPEIKDFKVPEGTETERVKY